MPGRANGPRRSLEADGKPCPYCAGKGCDFCEGKGRVWGNRGHFPITTGVTIKMDPLLVVPEHLHVVVAHDEDPAVLAERLEPLMLFVEDLAERLFVAPHEQPEVETASVHAKYERLLLKLSARAEAVGQGKVKAYPAYRLSDEQMLAKRQQAARSATRSLTHLAFVADRNRDNPVYTSMKKEGEEVWYVPKWVARHVPELVEAAFAAVELLASLVVFQRKAESAYARKRRELVENG